MLQASLQPLSPAACPGELLTTSKALLPPQIIVVEVWTTSSGSEGFHGPDEVGLLGPGNATARDRTLYNTPLRSPVGPDALPHHRLLHAIHTFKELPGLRGFYAAVVVIFERAVMHERRLYVLHEVLGMLGGLRGWDRRRGPRAVSPQRHGAPHGAARPAGLGCLSLAHVASTTVYGPIHNLRRQITNP